jgi:predicted MFS family arabinose efflux permease
VTRTKPETLMNRDFILLMVISLITSFGYNMISTLVSSYAIELGSNLMLAGTIAGIFSLAALFSRPFSGYASDILNRKKLCVASTVLISVAMVGYIVAPGSGAFLAVRILHGIAFGISGTANLALVSEYIPDKNMGQGLGYFGLGQVMAQVAGPGLGMYIKDGYGYKTLFFVIALLTMAAAVILFLGLRYESSPPRARKAPGERGKFRLDDLVAKECVAYALVGGLFSLGNGIINSFLVPIGSERAIGGIALFFSVNAIVLFLMRLMIGKIIDRVRLLIIVDAALLFCASSMAIAGLTASFAVMMAAAVLKAIGHGSGQIALQSACIRKVPAVKVGIATSTFYIGADIGQGLGPIIGGSISDRFGYSTMFCCVAAFIAVSMLVFSAYEMKASALSLDRPLQERGDDLALEEHEDQEGGHEDQDGPRAQ